MAITRVNNLLEWSDPLAPFALGIDSTLLQESIDAILKRRPPKVFGTEAFGFAEDNLDFLQQMPWVTDVWFNGVKLRSISALYALADLRSFGVMPKRPAIDFSRFPRLESMVLEPVRGDSGLASLARLKRMNIWRMKSGIEVPANIEELGVYWASAVNLDWLPCLPNLRKLTIERCRNLVDLCDLPSRAPHLTHLIIDTCGKVSTEMANQTVAAMPHLELAVIQRHRYKSST